MRNICVECGIHIHYCTCKEDIVAAPKPKKVKYRPRRKVGRTYCYRPRVKKNDGDNCLCLNCGHNWYSWNKVLGEFPLMCPFCHSIHWDKPKIILS